MSKQKIISTPELRKKKNNELMKLLRETRKIIAQHTIEVATKKSKDTNVVVKNRKLIARIKTVLYEQRILQEVSSS